jgi:hypothetical protein
MKGIGRLVEYPYHQQAAGEIQKSECIKEDNIEKIVMEEPVGVPFVQSMRDNNGGRGNTQRHKVKKYFFKTHDVFISSFLSNVNPNRMLRLS